MAMTEGQAVQISGLIHPECHNSSVHALDDGRFNVICLRKRQRYLAEQRCFLEVGGDCPEGLPTARFPKMGNIFEMIASGQAEGLRGFERA